MVDGFPQGLLARGSLPGRWGIGPEGFDVLLTLGHGRFQGGQTLELQSAEAVLSQVPDHLGHLRGGRQSTVGGSQGTGPGRRFLVGDHLPVVPDHELATALLQDFHLGPGITGPVLPRKQLQGAPLELDGVVPGHLARVLEAEDPLQKDRRVQGTIGHLRLLGRHTELLVELGQEFPQYGIGLVDGGGAHQPEFADQPVLEGTAMRSTRPLACGERAKTCSMPSSCMARLKWVASTGGWMWRGFPLNLKTPWRSP